MCYKRSLLCSGKRSFRNRISRACGSHWEPNKRVSPDFGSGYCSMGHPIQEIDDRLFLSSLIFSGGGSRFEFSDSDKEEKSGVWLIDGVSHKINTFLLLEQYSDRATAVRGRFWTVLARGGPLLRRAEQSSESDAWPAIRPALRSAPPRAAGDKQFYLTVEGHIRIRQKSNLFGRLSNLDISFYFPRPTRKRAFQKKNPQNIDESILLCFFQHFQFRRSREMFFGQVVRKGKHRFWLNSRFSCYVCRRCSDEEMFSHGLTASVCSLSPCWRGKTVDNRGHM